MFLTVNQHPTYCYTGGRPFDAAKPTLVFIHGVLNDHSVWGLLARYFAHHGYNVLAVDLPGHGKSEGYCPQSVEEAADFIWALLDAAGIAKAALIGHSWGSLIALHAASLQAERVSHLALLGTAFPMTVSPALLDSSRDHPLQAIELVNKFSQNKLAPPPSAPGPVSLLHGSALALMHRVLTSNPRENVFHTGFQACTAYENGFLALKQLITGRKSAQLAILFIVGIHDRMTTPKAAQALIDLAAQATVVLVNAGHNIMTQAPHETLTALNNWLTQPL